MKETVKIPGKRKSSDMSVLVGRLFTRALATATTGLPRHKLLPMPRLSPSMTQGTLLKWNISEGSELPENGSEVLFEVRCEGLLEDEPDLAHVMLIEAHEEGYLAKCLLQPGMSAEPDQPIAIVVENAADVAAFADMTPSERLVPPATFAWQAYLQSGGVACSNS